MNVSHLIPLNSCLNPLKIAPSVYPRIQPSRLPNLDGMKSNPIEQINSNLHFRWLKPS